MMKRHEDVQETLVKAHELQMILKTESNVIHKVLAPNSNNIPRL